MTVVEADVADMTVAEPKPAHDLGGMRGFGRVERDRQVQFADEWEAQVFGMTLACGMLGQWNLDQSRCAREQMQPQHYLASSYYEHWLHGLERLLVARGLVSPAELRSGKAAGKSGLQAIAAERVSATLRKGAPTSMSAESAPRFVHGARVRVRAITPQPHTRAPRYTQGCEGVIVRHHGAHIFPDQHAATGEKQPQHLYSVRFEAQELWGEGDDKAPDGKARAAVYVDLFEPYLAAADAST